MATPVLIDLSNYDTLLVQSTQSRAGTPNGNIFFDVATGKIEIITASELATVDLGSGAEANPLTNALGIKFEALYAFENQERRSDEALRKYDRFFKGTFKFGGAYEIINGRKFAIGSTSSDRTKVRGSGWNERSTAGLLDRIYFGNKGLGSIQGSSQPYYQLSAGGAPVNYAKAGQIDEAVQVFGTTANGDAGAGSFDSRTYEAVSIRTFGYNYDRKATTTDLSIAELGGYSTGFAVTESAHLTTGAYALADVYGGAQIAPWTGMRLVKCSGAATGAATISVNATAGTFTRATGSYLTDGFVPGQSITSAGYVNGGNNTTKVISSVTALVITVTSLTGLVTEAGGGDETITGSTVTVGGFNEADGAFSWFLNNTGTGNLNQCVAFLDALAQTDNDIDSGSLTTTNGKRVSTWYTYNASGQIVTRSGADALGLFIEAIPTADEQRIVFTDDAGNLKTRPFNVSLSIDPGSYAIADVLAWYHAFFLNGPGAGDDFNTSGALTVLDSSAAAIKGNVSTDVSSGKLLRAFDYDGDTLGGTPGTDKDVVFEVEGDGGATAAKTVFTISRTATINVTCSPGLETNQ